MIKHLLMAAGLMLMLTACATIGEEREGEGEKFELEHGEHHYERHH